MSSLGKYLRKLKKRLKVKPATRPPEAEAEPVERAACAEPESPAPLSLDELRHRARTGDPKLTDPHRSGKF